MTPPVICIVLELCKYGSLSDIIRGCNFNGITNEPLTKPLCLTVTDKLFLALGCAQGVAAIHAHNPNLCHRDIKSFNFLVDDKLNVKIADLEFGADERLLSSDEDRSCTEKLCSYISHFRHTNNFTTDKDSANVGNSQSQIDDRHTLQSRSSSLSEYLVNKKNFSDSSGFAVVHPSVRGMQACWLSSEVLSTGTFNQPSDIYALAIVFWEIYTTDFPFSKFVFQAEIQKLILSGYRHEFPAIEGANDAEARCLQSFRTLIRMMWVEDPVQRPNASIIVERLKRILLNRGDKYICMTLLDNSNVLNSSEISGTLDISMFSDLRAPSEASVPQMYMDDEFEFSNWSKYDNDGRPWIIVENNQKLNILYSTMGFNNTFNIRSIIGKQSKNDLKSVLEDSGYVIDESTAPTRDLFKYRIISAADSTDSNSNLNNICSHGIIRLSKSNSSFEYSVFVYQIRDNFLALLFNDILAYRSAAILSNPNNGINVTPSSLASGYWSQLSKTLSMISSVSSASNESKEIHRESLNTIDLHTIDLNSVDLHDMP
jgi:hypothetical protein